MLHKKQYRKIAEILVFSNSKKDFIDNLIDFFKEDNPAFDAYRFKEACCYNNLEIGE